MNPLDPIENIVNTLLVKHKEAIFQGKFQDVPEAFWSQLRLDIQYSSPVVSGQIDFEEACQHGNTVVASKLIMGRDWFFVKKSGKWRVHFPQSNRFMNGADLEDPSELYLWDDTEQLWFTNYDHMIECCRYFAEGYIMANMEPPVMVTIPFDKENKPIDWITFKYGL